MYARVILPCDVSFAYRHTVTNHMGKRLASRLHGRQHVQIQGKPLELRVLSVLWRHIRGRWENLRVEEQSRRLGNPEPSVSIFT